jgi:uncharacterized protein YdhG (YjbR/CyaY superfamily)
MDSVKRKPSTIDEYVAGLNADQRAVLEKLRKTIRAVAPDAAECISYGIPAFRLNGRSLVFFGAWVESLRVLSGEFCHVEKISERAKELSNQQGYASFLPGQTVAGRIAKKAR